MVPVGPKLDFNTSCSPSPALMLTARASPLLCKLLVRYHVVGGAVSYPRLRLWVQKLSCGHDLCSEQDSEGYKEGYNCLWLLTGSSCGMAARSFASGPKVQFLCPIRLGGRPLITCTAINHILPGQRNHESCNRYENITDRIEKFVNILGFCTLFFYCIVLI